MTSSLKFFKVALFLLSSLVTEINDEELKTTKDLDKKCEICIKYKRTKSQAIVGFPLIETFNETMAGDRKEWSHDKKIWLPHLVTRYKVFIVFLPLVLLLIFKKIFSVG